MDLKLTYEQISIEFNGFYMEWWFSKLCHLMFLILWFFNGDCWNNSQLKFELSFLVALVILFFQHLESTYLKTSQCFQEDFNFWIKDQDIYDSYSYLQD